MKNSKVSIQVDLKSTLKVCMKAVYNSLKIIALYLDRFLGTSFKATGGEVYRKSCMIISIIRRYIDPKLVIFKYKIGFRPANICLHLGCGNKKFEGFVNIDLWMSDATDIICDISRLPWPDNTVDRIESYHVIEHISHKKIENTLKEWHRVLKPGGRLILECPNLDRVLEEYLEGNENRLLNIFGRQRFPGDTHLFGYTPARLARHLLRSDFNKIIEAQPQSSQTLDEPSFRIECQKKP